MDKSGIPFAYSNCHADKPHMSKSGIVRAKDNYFRGNSGMIHARQQLC